MNIFKRIWNKLFGKEIKKVKFSIPYEEKGIAVNLASPDILNAMGRKVETLDRETGTISKTTRHVVRNRRTGQVVIAMASQLDMYKNNPDVWEVVESEYKNEEHVVEHDMTPYFKYKEEHGCKHEKE